jgi:hypothetical protein
MANAKKVIVNALCSSSGDVTNEGEINTNMVVHLDLSKINSDAGVENFLKSNIIVNENYRQFVGAVTFSGSQLSDEASYRY